MRALVTILVSLAAGAAQAQSGQIVPCIQGPVDVATIVVSPAAPTSRQPVSLSVSPGDHHTITALFPNSVTASVQGHAIEVVMGGFFFPRPGVFHVDGHCGVVTIAPLPGGTYDVYFVLGLVPLGSPGPPLPFVAATSSLTVSDPAFSPVPASNAGSLGAMALALLALACLRLRAR